ncbi:hypothetical protein NC651_033283 [Populus alba x Populus x berolinensis]|nr:hypothetical protein NC651_033283 [Populus alba x Populus x berolinensis]
MEKSSMKMAFFAVLLVFAAGELLEAVANAVDIVIWVAILTALNVPHEYSLFKIPFYGSVQVLTYDQLGCDSSGYWTMTAGWQFRRLWKLIVELYKEAQFSFRISLENAAPLYALICGKQLSIIVYSTSWRIPKGMPTRFGSCRNPRI